MATQRNIDSKLISVIDALSDFGSLKNAYHHTNDGVPFPSGKALSQIVDLTREVLFPGYFGHSFVDSNTLKYHIGVNVERLNACLVEQVLAGLCFDGFADESELESKKEKARQIASDFLSQLPAMREVLMTDVVAAYNGDPAAKSFGEIILCYPTIKAVSNHRIAHALLKLGVPLIPRMISELAHSETGIDIHPGATIGNYFAIDHGTGVVIGETAIIGNHVKLYQGVTLGAKSFQLDENGNPIKDLPRHPIVEDNVVVYCNATVLGRITIGEGATIGGNVWVTNDVPKGEKVFQSKVQQVSKSAN
ncbi:MAG: serine acetyltransferase [Paludibacteraceae bacterium]|nr:serine acetyltransferase [Paludibacteraceae bacterium]